MKNKNVTTYVLAGVPRAGKSIIQKRFLDEYKISGITTDLLREGFKYGIPGFGIKKEQTDNHRAEILWPYLKGILIARKSYSDKLFIEGVNFLPKYLKEFIDTKYIRMCFIGYCTMDPMIKLKNIRNNPSTQGEWTSDLRDEEILNLIQRWIKDSIYFKKECKKYNIQYFDISEDFNQVIDQVVDYLIKGTI